MIESTFCFLPGVGVHTERRWWKSGIETWSDFLTEKDVPGLGSTRKARHDWEVGIAAEHLLKGDVRFFAKGLLPRHHWRLYEWLRPKAVFLDIETDARGEITVIGLYGQGTMTSLIRGQELTGRRVRDELAAYDLLVTFCGASFDLPVLRAQFPMVRLHQPHIDLYRVARAAGLRGGLKAIEATVGITRRADVLGMDGSDAVRSWNRWRYGRDVDALERLLAYNQADCTNLQPLADLLYCHLARCRSGDVPPPLRGWT